MKTVLFCLFGTACSVAAQTVPVTGTDSTIEIANWNIQWFGSKTDGPLNDPLQLSNVAEVITQTNFDLWGFAEISDTSAWDSLRLRLPQYEGLLATFNQTQKTAILFRKNMFRFLYRKEPLSNHSYDFASGRLPLEVGLEVNMGHWKDTLVVFVIHLKANTGDEAQKTASWQRRKNAATALKTYIESLGQNRKCMVIGDWNDDLDSSVFEGHETPFSFWTSDTGDYFFPTLSLSLAKEKSMEAFSEFIDHQCVYGRMRYDAIPGSAKVLNLKNSIANYASTTSDHYPVCSFYRLKQSPYAGLETIRVFNGELYWDGQGLKLPGAKQPEEMQVYDLQGKSLSKPFPGLQMVRYRLGNRYFAQQILIPR